jgi:hypothetical protein
MARHSHHSSAHREQRQVNAPNGEPLLRPGVYSVKRIRSTKVLYDGKANRSGPDLRYRSKIYRWGGSGRAQSSGLIGGHLGFATGGTTADTEEV